MTFKEDIIARIKADFGNNSDKALIMIKDAINKTDYLKTDRIIRCILFLAKGSLIELNINIETATFDTRDIMLWAEYEKLNGDLNYKRLRDFNKTFEDCSINVKE